MIDKHKVSLAIIRASMATSVLTIMPMEAGQPLEPTNIKFKSLILKLGILSKYISILSRNMMQVPLIFWIPTI